MLRWMLTRNLALVAEGILQMVTFGLWTPSLAFKLMARQAKREFERKMAR